MAEQMRDYHDRRRGAHTEDEPGQKIILIAEHVFRNDVVRNMPAHIAALAKRH